MTNTDNVTPVSTNALLTDWLIPGLALLIIVTLLWVPFGFQMTGIVEKWGVVDLLDQAPIFYITDQSPMAEHRIRPLEVLPHTIAHILTPDSFVGFNILHWLFFWGKVSSLLPYYAS